MKEVVVTTKDELEKAVKDGIDTIIVQGKLANNVKRIKSIKRKSKITLLTLGVIAATIPASAILAPASGGVSIPIAYFTATSTAALTGTEIALILAIALLGMSLILQILDNYDLKMDAKGKLGDVEGEIILEKKQS